MEESKPSALRGLRVIELISREATAGTGKYLGDLGADVIVVEPPNGSPLRLMPPFVDDVADPNKSLRWWSTSTSKRSIVLDFYDDPECQKQLTNLIATADFVIEGESGEGLNTLGLNPTQQMHLNPGLIWVSITPFGRGGPRASGPATDLTLMAGGGPVWSCGYDDHSLPPIRGQGYQSFSIGMMFAVIGALTALSFRRKSGRGQLVEVNLNAACNVTTELASQQWLIAKAEVQRQTGRHANVKPSSPIQVLCGDGRYATTGVPARTVKQFQELVAWLEELSLLHEVPEWFFLKAVADGEWTPENIERDVDPVSVATFAAARAGLVTLARHLSVQEFFESAQSRGFQVGAIYAPEEAFENKHFVARDFQYPVMHDELAQTIRYPGAPFKMSATPWEIWRRPPLLGEHSAEVLDEILGYSTEQSGSISEKTTSDQ